LTGIMKKRSSVGAGRFSAMGMREDSIQGSISVKKKLGGLPIGFRV